MADGSKPDSDYDDLHRIMATRMSVRRLRPDPIPARGGRQREEHLRQL